MSEEVHKKISEAFAAYPERSYDKGQILVFGGENPSHIFYMLSGRVRLYDISARGDELVMNVFRPPSFFPMSWAINRSDNNFFYRTEEKTVVRVIPTEDAVEFIKAHPDVMFDLLRRVYSGMDGLFGRIVQLMSGSARHRLTYELAIDALRFGDKLKDGSYVIKETEGDLAARTGLSRETISREMLSLKKQGMVSITNKGIIVHDIDALRALTDTDT